MGRTWLNQISTWVSLTPRHALFLVHHTKSLLPAFLSCIKGVGQWQFSSVQFSSLSHVRLFMTPWTVAHQASQSITNSQSLLTLMSIELVMPSNHLILCCPLLLPPPIFPTIGFFPNESLLHIRWPKYWSFSFSILPMNIQDWFTLGCTGWLSLQSRGLSRIFSSTTVQKHQFFGAQLSL